MPSPNFLFGFVSMERSRVDPGSSCLRVDSSTVVEATSMFSRTSLFAEGGSGRSPGLALSARGGNPLSSIGLDAFLSVFTISHASSARLPACACTYRLWPVCLEQRRSERRSRFSQYFWVSGSGAAHHINGARTAFGADVREGRRQPALGARDRLS